VVNFVRRDTVHDRKKETGLEWGFEHRCWLEKMKLILLPADEGGLALKRGSKRFENRFSNLPF